VWDRRERGYAIERRRRECAFHASSAAATTMLQAWPRNTSRSTTTRWMGRSAQRQQNSDRADGRDCLHDGEGGLGKGVFDRGGTWRRRPGHVLKSFDDEFAKPDAPLNWRRIAVAVDAILACRPQ
jgi:hypothetical protein